MKNRVQTINFLLRKIFGIVCNIHTDEFAKIPKEGPLILVGNHINFLEAPIMMPHIDNPNVIGVAKRESWKNPLFNFLFNEWRVIPIERDMVDREAFNNIFDALRENKIVAIFPEGTRSKNGHLLKGKPGVVAVAVKSKAPIMPISFYGYENFWDNLKHFRKTDFYVAVGEPFRLNLNGNGLSKEVRQEVTDEIMYKIAELLPEKYLSNYPNTHNMSFKYIAATELN